MKQRNFEVWLADAQKRRMEFLTTDPNCFSGNRRERLQYLQYLDEKDVELTDYQYDACIGLCLSDASLQSGAASPREPEKTFTRLKMTQATKHESFVYHVKDVLRIFTGNENSLRPRSPRVPYGHATRPPRGPRSAHPWGSFADRALPGAFLRNARGVVRKARGV
jgi:hypothetical protein